MMMMVSRRADKNFVVVPKRLENWQLPDGGVTNIREGVNATPDKDLSEETGAAKPTSTSTPEAKRMINGLKYVRLGCRILHMADYGS